MQTYLTIVTTVLVVTQIIRVVQNTIQLKKYGETDKGNKEILGMWKRISRDLDEIKQVLSKED